MTHVSHEGTRVATVHDDYQRVEPGPPYHIAGLPRDTLMGIYGWPPHYPSVYPLITMGVPSNSETVEATMFAGPHKSCMRQYAINLVHWGQMTSPQLTQEGDTTFGAPNMKTDHSHSPHPVFSTFPLFSRLVSQSNKSDR
jgi:hypothetical protein